jgi:putative transposase
MSREAHVRFGERPEVKFPRPTHPYVPTVADFLYLAVVLGAWSRKIVGWSMANYLRSELVLDALEMAMGQRRPDGVIHHSDQGSQYTSLAFGKRCREAGFRPSM